MAWHCQLLQAAQQVFDERATAQARDPAAAQADAMVTVANRNFGKSSYNEPVAQVRSPGLPDNVRRMSDRTWSDNARIIYSVDTHAAK